MTEETRSAGELASTAPASGWRAAFPPAQWLAAYRAQWLAHDAIAGVTLAAYGIAVSLAYASLAGLPPQYGIYCYLVGGLFYALFGSSRQLAIGPTSAISMLVGVTVAGMAEGDPARWAAIAALTALVIAVMCVLAWLLRLSSLVNFISETILLGFKAGAALTIAMTQLPKLFGVKGGGEHFFERIVILGGQLPDTNLAVFTFGLAALAVLLLGEKFLPGRPIALFVVVVSIVVLSVTPLVDLGFKVVGALPQGLPDFKLPGLRVRDVDGVIPLAFACLLLAYVESVSAARAAQPHHAPAQAHSVQGREAREGRVAQAAEAARLQGPGLPVQVHSREVLTETAAMPRNVESRAALLAVLLALFFPGGAAEADPFVDDAKAGAQLRSLYFNRDVPTRTQESWAAGGWLWGRTGYWRDFLAFGGTLYASLPLYAPEDRDGTLSLKPGQDGFAVLGEAYARLKLSDQALTLYRQRIGENPQKAQGVRGLQTDLNYLGSRDIRMTPLTYEAAMLGGPLGADLRYQAGYVSKVKDINADKFVSMSRLAGVTAKDTGMWTGGLQWSPQKDAWVQASYYTVEDTIRIGYLDLDWVTRTSKDAYYRFAAQYSDQRSDGANLLLGRSFSTWNGGLYGEFGWNWLKAYGALGRTGEGEQIRNFYSFGPFYISQRVKVFSRAGEDAALLGTTFDLASAGLPGFSIDLNLADGRHAIDPVTRAALPKWREYDTDFIYSFAKESAVPGMRLRFRWARVNEDFGTRIDKTTDTRLDLNWAVSFN